MIRRNTVIPDNIFELAPQASMGDCARAYGDEIARRYEDLNVIYFPRFPLALDFAFLQKVVFPPQLKKIGTKNGLETRAFRREGDNVVFAPNTYVSSVFPDKMAAGYLDSQISEGCWQVRNALYTLLPRYFSLAEFNITWRMTETVDECMHIDGFRGGSPTPAKEKGRLHRVKLFVNIDSVPRKWRTSCALPEILKRCRDKFPQGLPDDVDQLSYALQYAGVLTELPYHEIDIPPMGAILADGGGIAHAVRYGRRLIAAEFLCARTDMLDPEKQAQVALRGWLAEAGIPIDPVPRNFDPPPGATAYTAA